MKAAKTTPEQKEKLMRAKIALALRDETGKTPQPEEVEKLFRLAKILRKAVLGTHFDRIQQERSGQLPLF